MNVLAMIQDARTQHVTLRMDEPRFVVMNRTTYRAMKKQLRQMGWLQHLTEVDFIMGLQVVVIPAETFHLMVLGGPEVESKR